MPLVSVRGVDQVIQRAGAVGEMADVVHDAGAADVFLDQPRMALIVLDHDDADGLVVVHARDSSKLAGRLT